MNESAAETEVDASVDPNNHETLAEALLAAQAEMPAVDRDKENPHFKNRFTSLDNLLAKARPVLNRHGLVLMQAPDLEGDVLVLRTILMHSSGEKMVFSAPLASAKNDPQSQGSAITYMRRYSAASMLAIADQEDDDGGRPTSTGSEPLTDERALALLETLGGLRAEIREFDADALPDASFEHAIQTRAHDHALLEEFVGKLEGLRSSAEGVAMLSALVEEKLTEAAAKKVLEKAGRRSSRSEKAEILRAAIDKANEAPGS